MNHTTYPILSDLKLRLYNTESRQKEVLNPIEPKHIRLYTCGPTVYNFAHIGNFRTYIFEDLLRRSLEFFGIKVTQVMNLTDVDDKTIKGAIEKGISLDAYTKPFTEAFFEDLKTLLIEPAEYYPQATDYIPQMIEMIQVLMQKEVAYLGGDGSIYFAIKKFPRYGCLSHLNLDELQVGASERVATDEYEKENVSDFVLWKKYDPKRDGEIYWESPFGKGRPGWHLECSAMATHLLGETIDIHVGGIDNMFPHHENEIAQSECCSGTRFVNLWMHAEHLVVDGKKMSKSLGNFFTLRDLLNRGYSGKEIRYALLQTHYKTQLNFTFKVLDAVKGSLARLQDFIQRMQEIQDNKTYGQISPILEKTYRQFAQSLADDLNISSALAAIFEMMRDVNSLSDQGKIGKSEALQVLDCLKKFNSVLGFLNFEKEEEEIPAEMHALLNQRNQARKDKNWKAADELRDQILTKGYVIEDTSSGIRLKKTKF